VSAIDELPANREDIRQRVRDVQLDGWMRPTQVIAAFVTLELLNESCARKIPLRRPAGLIPRLA
jgi:hypothetical protein